MMNKPLWATLAAPILIIIIYLFLSYNNLPEADYKALIASIGATSALYLGLVKYWIDSDTMFKTLFKDFNARFDLLNEDLNKIVDGTYSSNTRTIEQVIQDYLNLCAEEYYWKKKGRIPKEVWTSWLAGIHDYISKPVIKDFFKGQLSLDASYYGFLSFIEKKLS
jgi:hypothetical protein